jgi:hypothetical protein
MVRRARSRSSGASGWCCIFSRARTRRDELSKRRGFATQ